MALSCLPVDHVKFQRRPNILTVSRQMLRGRISDFKCVYKAVVLGRCKSKSQVDWMILLALALFVKSKVRVSLAPVTSIKGVLLPTAADFTEGTSITIQAFSRTHGTTHLISTTEYTTSIVQHTHRVHRDVILAAESWKVSGYGGCKL